MGHTWPSTSRTEGNTCAAAAAIAAAAAAVATAERRAGQLLGQRVDVAQRLQVGKAALHHDPGALPHLHRKEGSTSAQLVNVNQMFASADWKRPRHDMCANSSTYKHVSRI